MLSTVDIFLTLWYNVKNYKGSEFVKTPKNVPHLSALTFIRHEISRHMHNIYNTNQLLSMRHKTVKDQRDINLIKSNSLAALKKFSNFAEYHANPNDRDAYTQVNLQNVDIVKVVRSMYERIVELVAVERNINFRLKTGVDSVLVVADIKRLEIILYNLISNSARHATRTDDNKIVLEIKNNDNHVVISVRDLSGGIMPEDQDIIFEAYKSAESSAIHPKTGSGLGLAVSLKLAHEMNGKIMFETIPGHGSEFSVVLPKGHSLPKEAATVSDICDTFEPDDMLILMYFSDVV